MLLIIKPTVRRTFDSKYFHVYYFSLLPQLPNKVERQQGEDYDIPTHLFPSSIVAGLNNNLK